MTVILEQKVHVYEGKESFLVFSACRQSSDWKIVLSFIVGVFIAAEIMGKRRANIKMNLYFF